jgi:hypothetical protein
VGVKKLAVKKKFVENDKMKFICGYYVQIEDFFGKKNFEKKFATGFQIWTFLRIVRKKPGGA